MLKLLFALLVLALVAALWLLADVLSLPAWAVPTATLVALTLLVILVAVELLQRRNRRLREARREAERSTLHQVLLGLRSRCDHAADLLRQQGADSLPWFFVLGPTGAGKTAALRSSGLRFRDGLGPDRFIVGGDVSPTENIQILASDRAVFLDTAGRYLCDAADHDDRREWLELLALLHTSGHSPAGVIVTLSASELAAASPEDAAGLGHALRRRLDDIQREFAVTVPVHLLVTKLDALAGLARLLADDSADRFGLVVELSGAGTSAAQRVAEGPLAELTLALERRAFACLGHAAVAEERGELYRSPGLFRQLADRTTGLLATLFPDHGEADAPIWRGLFFASAGSTHPRPTVDPELERIAREYNSPPQQGDTTPPPLPRPLFLQALFATQLLADAWITAPTHRKRARLRTSQILRSAALSVAAAGFFLITLESARSNHRLLGEVNAAVAHVERDHEALNPNNSAPILPREIAPLQAVARKLSAQAEHGPPWSMRWGLYQGDDLDVSTIQAFRARARARLLLPLVERARDHLTRLHNQHKDSRNPLQEPQFWAAVDALHLYLLLTRPNPNNGLTLSNDEQQQRWLVQAMTDAWLSALALPPRERDDALAFSRAYVPTIDVAAELPPGDPALIEGVRQILRRSDRGQMWVDHLLTREIPGTRHILLSSIAAGARWLTNKDQKVHAAFTRPGWDAIRAELRCNAAESERFLTAAVVIDQRPCEDERKLLHGRYFDNYIQEWIRFIDDIYVVEPGGADERERYSNIEAQIVAMSTIGGPGANALEMLFRVIGENAQLPQADPAGSGPPPANLIQWTVAEHRRRLALAGGRDPYAGAGDAVSSVTQVRDALHGYYSYGYAPPGDPAAGTAPLKAYVGALAAITTPLNQYNKERDQEALAQARERAREVFNLINDQHLIQRPARWKPILRGLLEPPIRGLLDAITRGQLDTLTDRWCNEVVIPFDHMRTCYPFTRTDACDTGGDEVTALFQPQNGSLWKLYHEELTGRFPFSGDKYVTTAQGYSSRVKLNPDVAVFLTNAKELGDVLFPLGSPDPGFNFSLQFKSLVGTSDIALVVDGGTPVSFNNSNLDRFQPVKWPGEGSNPGALLKATTRGGVAQLERAGFWGLFKLFELADIRRDLRLIALDYRFTGGGTTATLRINPSDGSGNPLFGRLRPDSAPMDIFRAPRLVPPRSLFIGGKTCKPT